MGLPNTAMALAIRRGLTPESWVSAIDEQMAQMSQLLEGG